jgi:hypothetical protein
MSPRQFREAIAQQNVPHLKLGKRVVVFFADLERLAHANASALDTHSKLRDEHDLRLTPATPTDNLSASMNQLHQHDAVPEPVGRTLTDEVRTAYEAGHDSRPMKVQAHRPVVVHVMPSIKQAQPQERAARRDEPAPDRTRPPREEAAPRAKGPLLPASTWSTSDKGDEREISIIHPAWDRFLDFLVEGAFKDWKDRAEKIRRGELIETIPVKASAKFDWSPHSPDEPELLTVEEAVVRQGVSREEILGEFEKNKIPFEFVVPAGPRARRKASNGHSTKAWR